MKKNSNFCKQYIDRSALDTDLFIKTKKKAF